MNKYLYIMSFKDSFEFEYCKIGVSNNVKKRVYQHNNTRKSAKYTRSRRPVSLVWTSAFLSRSEAQKLEHQIKKFNKQKKEDLVAGTISISYNFIKSN